MKNLPGVVSGIGMVIALAGMQAQERVAPSPTPTPQSNRATNLNTSRSNRTVERGANPTPNADEARAKDGTSKPIIQNIKAREGRPNASPTPGGRRAAPGTPTPDPGAANNLNSSRSNRQAPPTPTASPR